MSIKNELKKVLIPWKNWITVQSKHFFNTPKRVPQNSPEEIIASITSYPPRFGSLHLTLKSLTQQSQPANKILLWIAHEDKALVPKSVLKLEQQGLIEIHFTEDTKSYKKIIPALKGYPKASIITFDDDVFYPSDALQKLILLHKKHPNNVIANRTHIIKTDEAGHLSPYKQWRKNCSDPKHPDRNFQTGIGGVLYPPHSLHTNVMDQDLFTKLAPHGDDIWLYWTMRLNGNFAIKTDNDYKFYHWPFSQKTALYKRNVRTDGNDIQIDAMLKHFGSPLNVTESYPEEALKQG